MEGSLKRAEDKQELGDYATRVTRGQLFSIFLKAGLAFGVPLIHTRRGAGYELRVRAMRSSSQCHSRSCWLRLVATSWRAKVSRQ